MNETLGDATGESQSQVDSKWQRRLDDLVRGECSEEDFLQQIWSHGEVAPDSVWNIVALLDQRYRRGQMPVALFRSVESKIAQRELMLREYGMTGNLHAAPASFRGVTQTMVRTGDTCVPQALVPEKCTFTIALEPQATPSTNSSVRLDEQRLPPGFESGRGLRDRYVLGTLLGIGGMSAVFNAVDRYRCDLLEADRHVAIKVLYEKIGSRPELMSHLRREFYCAQTLSHRNIVKVYELDQEDDVAFFTMELLAGEPLSSVIERMRLLAIPRSYAWAIIKDVGAGLAHAHSRNVVHADIKPQNIMITTSGEVRILDFGLPSVVTRERWSADRNRKNPFAAVTPAYACCELLDGQQADRRDDLYALACLSYELLAGEHPFQGRTSTEARDLGMVPARPLGLTRRQWQTLAKGLSWSREERSISVRDWLAQLGVGPEPEGRLPCADDLNTALPRQRTVQSLLVVTLFAMLFIATATLISLNRPPFDKINSANDPVPRIPVKTSASADATPKDEISISAGNDPPGLTSKEPITQVSLPTVDLEPVLRPPAQPSAPRPMLKNAQLGQISLSTGRYKVRAGQSFAEIRVRRPSGSDADVRFVWWTESSSAKPGVDYVSQDRAIRVLSKGERNASLFVKLIPNISRSRSEVFYVAMDNPRNASSPGGVSRAVILLPASK
jgi:serine/threonine protein kinase